MKGGMRHGSGKYIYMEREQVIFEICGDWVED
jgi:hypothetical protein